jgi:hypothetical protein
MHLLPSTFIYNPPDNPWDEEILTEERVQQHLQTLVRPHQVRYKRALIHKLQVVTPGNLCKTFS